MQHKLFILTACKDNCSCNTASATIGHDATSMCSASMSTRSNITYRVPVCRLNSNAKNFSSLTVLLRNDEEARSLPPQKRENTTEYALHWAMTIWYLPKDDVRHT